MSDPFVSAYTQIEGELELDKWFRDVKVSEMTKEILKVKKLVKTLCKGMWTFL